MPKFSKRSLENLSQCHPDIVRVMTEVVKRFDIVVICGHRGEAEQELAFKRGTSEAHWLQSPHNYEPALAVDVCPYPIDWNNYKAFDKMQDIVLEVAEEMGVELVSGADFDNDGIRHERGENDNPHFQLANWKELRYV